MEDIAKDIINNIVDNIVKEEICYVCHEEVSLPISRFCCNKRYHEGCIVKWVATNQYPKCPVCRKWVKMDIKKACDTIYQDYLLREARTKLHIAIDYTQDISPYGHTGTSTDTQTQEIIDLLESGFDNEPNEEIMRLPESPSFTTASNILGTGNRWRQRRNALPPLRTRSNSERLQNEPNRLLQSQVNNMRSFVRHLNNHSSMMEQMFDQSWNNFYNGSS